jgi:hypothetical protein
MIQQAPAGLPFYQQIEIAVLIRFTSGHGAKNAQAVGAATPGEPEDFRPPFRAQCVQGDHVSIVRQFRAANTQASRRSTDREHMGKVIDGGGRTCTVPMLSATPG